MARCHLVLIEASGIQRFIFSTNKRRENVGASHLVASVSTWVEEELAALIPGWDRAARLVPVADQGLSAELVTAAAGSAKILVSDDSLAEQLIRAVTVRALRIAPGLDVCGVHVPFDWQVDGEAAAASREAHRVLPAVRARRPGPQARFLRLPIMEACATSGLPASRLEREGPVFSRDERPAEPPVPRSLPSLRKLSAANDGYDRLASLYPQDNVLPHKDVPSRSSVGGGLPPAPPRAGLEAVADYLERHADWVAVVHADGNGLGKIFQDLAQRVGRSDSRGFFCAQRKLSAGVDAASQAAFQDALSAVAADPAATPIRRPQAGGSARPGRQQPGRQRSSPEQSSPERPAGARAFLPVLPLVLGGDDVTVVCDGRIALAFTVAYLRAFERRTAEMGVPGVDRLAACAGVAIVKMHYPFSAAYRLAAELTAEAKQVKAAVSGPASALSFHVLHDSAATSLETIRGRQAADQGRTRLVAQPYLVSGPPDGWAARRTWADLLQRVAALRAAGADGGRLLPRSQTHDLRDGLFEGHGVADSRFRLLLHRYADRGLDQLGAGSSLFWDVPSVGAAGGPTRMAGLLDAMDADPFLSALSVEADDTSLAGAAR